MTTFSPISEQQVWGIISTTPEIHSVAQTLYPSHCLWINPKYSQHQSTLNKLGNLLMGGARVEDDCPSISILVNNILTKINEKSTHGEKNIKVRINNLDNQNIGAISQLILEKHFHLSVRPDKDIWQISWV